MSIPLVIEPVIEGRISGSAVVADLLRRIRERLERNNDLRETDSYSSYNARITIDLDLVDVDPTKVLAELVVGTVRNQSPPIVPQITFDVPAMVASDVAAEQPSLERSVDGSPVEPHVFAQPNLEKPIIDSPPPRDRRFTE